MARKFGNILVATSTSVGLHHTRDRHIAAQVLGGGNPFIRAPRPGQRNEGHMPLEAKAATEAAEVEQGMYLSISLNPRQKPPILPNQLTSLGGLTIQPHPLTSVLIKEIEQK